MPAVEKVEALAEGICDRISVISRRLMLQSKASLDDHGISWREWQVLTNLMLGGETPRSPSDLRLDADGDDRGDDERARPARGGGLDPAGPEPGRPAQRDRPANQRRSRALVRGGERLGEQEAGVVAVLTASEQRQLNALLRKLLAGFGGSGKGDED